MKTNREKYPNTDDALAAWKKHREECKCDCEFDDWLKAPCAEDIKEAIKSMPTGISMTIAGLLAGSIMSAALKARMGKKEESASDNEKPDNEKPDDAESIECPICHKKNGYIKEGMFYAYFKCRDCGVSIAYQGEGSSAPINDTAEVRRRIVAATAKE